MASDPKQKILAQIRTLIESARGEGEEQRSKAWVACKLILEHGVTLSLPVLEDRAMPAPVYGPPVRPDSALAGQAQCKRCKLIRPKSAVGPAGVCWVCLTRDEEVPPQRSPEGAVRRSAEPAHEKQPAHEKPVARADPLERFSGARRTREGWLILDDDDDDHDR